MRVETNTVLVRRNRKIAQYMFFVSLGLLMGGFVATNAGLIFQQLDADLLVFVQFAIPALILPVAFASTLFSVRMTNLWVRMPRPDELIPDNLKGLGQKAVLYNYYHFPARHVLICDQGVFAVVTRFQQGNFRVNGDKWSSRQGLFSRLFRIFRMDGIGNPTADALIAAERVQKSLASIAPDVEVQPVIVFIDPRVKLEITNPVVPVVYAQTRSQPSFKDYIKGLRKKKEGMMMTPEQILAFEQATGVAQKE